MSEEGQLYHVTRLPEDMNSICRVESQTESWHPHRHLAPPHSASAPVCANTHGFIAHTAAGWRKFGTQKVAGFLRQQTWPWRGLPWEHHCDRQQSSCLHQTCLTQTLHTAPFSLRAHWMPLSVLQAQQDTNGDRNIYIGICCGCSPAALHPETLLCAQRILSVRFSQWGFLILHKVWWLGTVNL